MPDSKQMFRKSSGDAPDFYNISIDEYILVKKRVMNKYTGFKQL